MSDLKDPRVLFAAERTLLAWNRSCLALMGFGFVIERFGLFLRYIAASQAGLPQERLSPWIGLAFILLGSSLAILSTLQYRSVLKTLDAAERPPGYWVNLGVFANLVVATLGLVIAGYLYSQR